MLTSMQRVKIELMTSGIIISEQAKHQLSGMGGERPLTLADYASTSGLTLELDENLWVNAPLNAYNPNFVNNPAACLHFSNDRFYIEYNGMEYRAWPVPVPEYHDKANKWGEPYTRYCITHTDRARISPVEGCSNTCQFCNIPFELTYATKHSQQLACSVETAFNDPVLPAHHILVSGGTPRADDFNYLTRVYEEILDRFHPRGVDIMMTPKPGLLNPKRLFELGANELCINLELFNEEIAAKLMPEKGKITQKGYLDFIENAVLDSGPWRVRSLLMVGLEPMEDTLRGVRALAQRGCEPVLSPFRPDPNTPLKNMAPPSAVFLAEVYERSAQIADSVGAKLGPKCIPCQHNTLTFADDSGYYHYQPSFPKNIGHDNF